MASSDDDAPLSSRQNANGHLKPVDSSLSAKVITHHTDERMDDGHPTSEKVAPGISIHNGPIDQMDIDGTEVTTHEFPAPAASGVLAGKRKSQQGRSDGKERGEEIDDGRERNSTKRRRMSAAEDARAKAKVKASLSSSDSDDQPIMAKKGPAEKNERQKNGQNGQKARSPSQSSDADVPLVKKLEHKKEIIEKRAEQEAKAIRKNEKAEAGLPAGAKAERSRKKQKVDEKVDEIPLSKNKNPRDAKPKSSPSGPKKAAGAMKKAPSDDEDDDDQPLRHKKSANKVTSSNVKTGLKKSSEKASKAKRKAAIQKASTEEDEAAEAEEEEYRWWEDPNKSDGSRKWTTLEHAGVVFPPAYEALPKHVKLHYNGVPVTLQPGAEEVAGFFGSMLNSTHNVENPTFIKNFFQDFKEALRLTGGAKTADGKRVKIDQFEKCDFRPIFEYFDAQRTEKKALPAAEKKRLKAEKDAAEAPYLHCLWDGRKERVGNFRVEPPSLFRGRGEHPKTGHLKKRVMPEQITINIGKEAMVPTPPEGHTWKEVRHDQTVTWLAMWQENINGAYKYVMLAADSAVKGQSDFAKFEKARELKKHIDLIRKDYQKNLKAELMADRQKATAVYLIDRLALRAGNEKGEDEADTVGCCSLKFEHVTLKPPRTVVFDFLGKDSIRFYNEVEVDEQVFRNLKIFKKAPKGEGDEIFDRLKTTQLNQHLSSYMSGLSAKVFRTYNASFTMANLLKDMKSEGTIPEKIVDYNNANRQVAILCNHKRTIPNSHAGQMEKLSDKIKGLRYQKWRVKQMMLALDPKLRKKKGADFFALDDDLDEAWIGQHQAELVQEQRQKIEKKFQKENEKLEAEGGKPLKDKELLDRLKAADELEAMYQKENRTKKVEPDGRAPTVEKMEANMVKLDQRVEAMLMQATEKENNKEVALGTSKINYIDPRLTVVFSKKFNVPIERFFAKSLREKFDWAIKSVDENWEF